MRKIYEKIEKGIVLAELAGYSDGDFCASHGAGAALVMLGTYIIDDGPVDYDYSPDFVFSTEQSCFDQYLKDNVTKARTSGALVGVSAVSVRVENSIQFLKSAMDAGADCVSLCLHSTLDIFRKSGTSAALCHRRNWDHLKKWTERLMVEVKGPVIFKMGLNDSPDMLGAVAVIAQAGIPLVHMDCEDTKWGSAGLAAIKDIKERVGFLIVSGGVKEVNDVYRILDAGADAVAVGSAAIRDAELCGRLQTLLKRGC